MPGSFSTNIHIPKEGDWVAVRRSIQQIRQYLVDLEGVVYGSSGEYDSVDFGLVGPEGFVLVNGDEDILVYLSEPLPFPVLVNGDEDILVNGTDDPLTYNTDDIQFGDIYLVA